MRNLAPTTTKPALGGSEDALHLTGEVRAVVDDAEVRVPGRGGTGTGFCTAKQSISPYTLSTPEGSVVYGPNFLRGEGSVSGGIFKMSI